MHAPSWWLACIPLAAVVLVLACGGNGDSNNAIDGTPPERIAWTLDEARGFDGNALYWLGEAFDGHRVTDVSRTGPVDDTAGSIPEGSVLLTYGMCEPIASLQDENGCSPPIQMIQAPSCPKPNDLTDHSTFRGDALIVEAGETLVYVWTGDVAVRIFAKSKTLAMDVANALVSLNSSAVQSPNDPLPAISGDC